MDVTPILSPALEAEATTDCLTRVSEPEPLNFDPVVTDESRRKALTSVTGRHTVVDDSGDDSALSLKRQKITD